MQNALASKTLDSGHGVSELLGSRGMVTVLYRCTNALDLVAHARPILAVVSTTLLILAIPLFSVFVVGHWALPGMICPKRA